jgi:hypothetical protein
VKSSFRIRHGQPEFLMGQLMPAGPIAIFSSNFTSSALSGAKGHTSRKGVKYPGLRGTSRYQPQMTKVHQAAKDKKFVLALQVGATHYLQRHGTVYRLNKLVATGVLKTS